MRSLKSEDEKTAEDLKLMKERVVKFGAKVLVLAFWGFFHSFFIIVLLYFGIFLVAIHCIYQTE